MDQVIKVERLSKIFKVATKTAGFVGTLTSLFTRAYSEIKAIDNISFEITESEFVGLIGPNGAGKTTTLKVLSGLLYPTSGEVSVLGFTPWVRQAQFQKQFSLVAGQKNQLWWDLPPAESFLLNKEIYEISAKQFKKTVSLLFFMTFNLVDILAQLFLRGIYWIRALVIEGELDYVLVAPVILFFE